jgi:predicted nucleic acid-binding protein
LIDAGVIIGNYHRADVHRVRARRLVDEIARGVHGTAFVTDYVVAEALNYAVAKCRDRAEPERIARSLLGESNLPWAEWIQIDEPMWRRARERFRILSRAGLSFTDCTSIAAVEHLGLKAIVSFDSGFDGQIPRIS